jgi:serine/threonine protein kinase
MNPRWLAPEIFDAAPYTAASDVFAFGVVMWELLTWDVPWTGYGEWQIVTQLRTGGRPTIPPADQLPGGTFPGLQAYVALMQRCWAQEPGDRPSFALVAEELGRMVEKYPKY